MNAIPTDLIKITREYWGMNDRFGYNNNKSINETKVCSGMESSDNNATIRLMGRKLAVSARKYLWRIKVTKDQSKIEFVDKSMFKIGVIEKIERVRTKTSVVIRDDGIGKRNDEKYGKKICPAIKSGDIVAIELNMGRCSENRQVSIGLNDDWYGVIGLLYGKKFRLYVEIMEPGITVEIIDFYEEKEL